VISLRQTSKESPWPLILHSLMPIKVSASSAALFHLCEKNKDLPQLINPKTTDRFLRPSPIS
jgi:hypothetical protein